MNLDLLTVLKRDTRTPLSTDSDEYVIQRIRPRIIIKTQDILRRQAEESLRKLYEVKKAKNSELL